MNSVLGRTSLFAALLALLAVMIIAVIGATTAQACTDDGTGKCPPRVTAQPKTYLAWADLDGRPVAKKYPTDKNGKSLRVKNFVRAGDRVYIHCQAYAKDGTGLYDRVSHTLKGRKLFVPDRYVRTGRTGRFLKAC